MNHWLVAVLQSPKAVRTTALVLVAARPTPAVRGPCRSCLAARLSRAEAGAPHDARFERIEVVALWMALWAAWWRLARFALQAC